MCLIITNMLLSFPPCDSNLFFLLIQCRWSDWDLSSVFVRTFKPQMNQPVFVHECVWGRDGAENTWGVRVSTTMHVCHIACTYCTVCGSRGCICMSLRSLGRAVWIQWEDMKGERCGLGRRSEPRLMPVCINAVWHLSALDMHTLWCAEILWHCVCVSVCVCVIVKVLLAKLRDSIWIFF